MITTTYFGMQELSRQCVETIQGEPKLKLYFPMVMEYPTIVLGNCSKQ